MSFLLLLPIFIPIIVGIAVLFIKDKKIREYVVLATTGIIFLISIWVFFSGELYLNFKWFEIGESGFSIDFDLLSDRLSSFILLFVTLFGILITSYSVKYMEGREKLNEYYAYLLWTIGTSAGAVLSSNLVIFLLFWGLAAVPLYFLIAFGGPKAIPAAKKTFIIVGGSDMAMLLGIVLIFYVTGSLSMISLNIPVVGAASAAFILLLLGAIAKAGAMPLHTWIPDSATVAPQSVMAFLPASLDKLLGIYLLARICLDLFVIKSNTWMSILLMAIGAITIVAAVMMALVQHDLRKLLSYHAVSQVGYMFLGIGTGIPVGIAGGLFHMLNHAIYKCCLFLGGGAVEKKTGETELDKLGGLVTKMPITFICTLVAALSISGIPPFNGFVSKWMVYQGTIQTGGKLFPIFLVAALIGSALTLASFMKFIHSIFFAEKSKEVGEVKEAESWMTTPMLILAALCIVFGVFANQIPLKLFILPSVPVVIFPGFFRPTLATVLLVIGLLIGFGIYYFRNVKVVRRAKTFIGGEELPPEATKVSGVRFYDTIKNLDIIKEIYEEAEAKFYDVYELLSKLTFAFGKVLRWLHNGLLHTYLAWILLGLVIILYLLVR